MDKALIEKMAQLRGIGDAYHNYRGQLQHFSLETKAGILSAMGCAVEDSGELAAQIAQVEAARWRKFLPDVATARGARVSFDINVAARELAGVVSEAGMNVQSAAAALSRRNRHFAPILAQHSQGSFIEAGETQICDAAAEKCHAIALWTLRRQYLTVETVEKRSLHRRRERFHST